MPYLPVLLAAALAAGAAGGVARPEWLAWALAMAGGSLVAALAAWRGGRPRAIVPLVLAGVAAASAARGSLAFTAVARPPLVVVLEEAGVLATDGAAGDATVRLEGTLTADAVPAGRSVLLRVQVARAWVGPCGCAHEAAGATMVAVTGDLAIARMSEWRGGRRVRFTATVRVPRAFKNVGASDARVDLVRRRAALVASVKSALLVELVAHGSVVNEAAAAVRARARTALRRATGPTGAQAAAIGTAVLVGDRAGLDMELQQRLQRAGTYHVIAISGGNIVLFTVVVLGVARLLTRRRPHGLAGAAVALLAYAVVVGGGASVLRATGMALVGIATQWLDQRGAAVNVLAFTAGLLVAADPLLAFDVSFWLTTAATAGIMVGLPSDDSARSRVGVWCRTLVLTSVWAELALLPIVASVFQQVTVAGLVLSAVAIPGMAVAQLAAAGAVLADVVVPVTVPVFGALLRVGAGLVTGSARLVDLAPWTSWRVPPPSVGATVAYYGAFAAWLWSRHSAPDTQVARRARRGTMVALPVAIVWVAVAPLSLIPWAPGDLQVTAFDVGQGDAMLVQFPNGRRLLVDAGGVTGDGRDLGERVVGPALRARGIRRVDYLLITHADADHIGGAASLVREFRPYEVWTGIPVADDAATARLRRATDAVGAAWRRVTAGDSVEVGAAAVHVLHPRPAEWERQRVRNDDSVVVAVTLGAAGVLLTGDIGDPVEPTVADAWSRLTTARLTVLKVAHHGSAGGTSAAFLEATSPQVAIVSAGAGNPFGHPAPAVLERLRQVGAEPWRTDVDGEITVRTDGRTVEVSSFTGRRRWLHAQPR